MTTSTSAFTTSPPGFYEGCETTFCLGGLVPTATQLPVTNMVVFTTFPSPAPPSPVARTVSYAVERYDDLLRRLAD